MEGSLFGFGINPASVHEAVTAAQEAERLGYSRIGVWDSPSLVRETWVTLTAMAVKTNMIRLGPWVTNCVSRHPVVTASAIAALEELAPGRVVCGVGTGHTGIMEARRTSLVELERFVVALRTALHDGVCQWRGRDWRFPWRNVQVPILVAAHGKNSLRMAARVADGVIVGLGVEPRIVANCMDLLEAECSKAGRHIGDLETWWVAPWYVDPVPGLAKEAAIWHTVIMAHHLWRGGVKDKWVPSELVPAIEQVGSAYQLSLHGGVPESARRSYMDLVRKLGLSDYLLKRFTFSGTPDEVTNQVHMSMKAGARCFDGAIDALPGELLNRPRLWARYVLPRLE